jgi:hypothetical protein
MGKEEKNYFSKDDHLCLCVYMCMYLCIYFAYVETLSKGMIYILNRIVQYFTMLIKITHNLKLMNYLFLEFSI